MPRGQPDRGAASAHPRGTAGRAGPPAPAGAVAASASRSASGVDPSSRVAGQPVERLARAGHRTADVVEAGQGRGARPERRHRDGALDVEAEAARRPARVDGLPRLVSPAPRNVAIASLAPATTGRSSGRPSSAAGPDRSLPTTVPARAAGGAIRSSSPAARASATVIASTGSWSDAAATPVIRNARWSHAARSQAASSTTSGRSVASRSARPSRPTTQPPRPIVAAAAAVSRAARRSSHVIAGARARPSAAVATRVGPWPTTQMASGAAGPSTRGLGQGDANPADEGGPPGLGVLLCAAGRAVEEQGVRDPGESTQAPVRGEDARLEGGGPEVDGDEDAGISSHGRDRR